MGRRENLVIMFRVVAVLALASLAQCAPGGGHFAYGHQQKHCHTKYNIKQEQSCHTEYDQACHAEYDTIVDTSYVEECQDIVTQKCHQVSQQVHHSSAVVGHNSQVIGVGHRGHYAKREANPGHSDPHNHLQCFSKPNKECHQKPVQDEHEECHVEHDVIVDTTYIEECEEVITTHCEHDSLAVKHHSQIVGHDSQVVEFHSSDGIISVKLVAKATLADLNVMQRRTISAIRNQFKMNAKFLEQFVRRL